MNWQRWGDAGLCAVLSVPVLAESGARQDPWWFRLTCVALVVAAVLLRRRRPLVALGLVTWAESAILAFSLGTTNGVPIALIPAITVLSYLAGRRETQLKHFVLWCGCTEIGLLVFSLAIRRAQVQVTEAVLSWLVVILLGLLLVVLPWLIGRYRAQQALIATAGWERAERIEREQRMEIAQERLRERSRIAQDMHDSVGHELSLIALRAAALELDPALPEQQRAAASELRAAAATATERLGEIIGVLRDSDAPTAPRDETVAALVERAAASGLDVELVEKGIAELAPMVDRAVHRVVQESLTNASKHAPGATITVTITRGEPDVRVQVADTGAARAVPESVPSSGRGLDGLRERVRLAGGTLTAGRRPGGGFVVTAEMPRIGGRPEPEATPELSGAAQERASVRRGARRRLITTVAVPALLGAVIGIVALGYYLIAGYSSILRPAAYDGLRIGQTESDVRRVLPAMEMIDPPADSRSTPSGWSCRYYRPDAPFSITYVYRLCFADGRLVAKSVVQSGSVPPTPEGER
ncbi:two-component sensor histidine kinase [Kribbella sandramycini]|uniref:histidine kinase n=1 Tax=Kribbella sandramycini TaxID=60450 RepID=A0A7Y4KYH1_9ACTN|nr:signal transduction histidine kinase [Kribbella sandramycini]NOL41017.1 two-component sensor histidine kinase [Kribbella sandramycini]